MYLNEIYFPFVTNEDQGKLDLLEFWEGNQKSSGPHQYQHDEGHRPCKTQRGHVWEGSWISVNTNAKRSTEFSREFWTTKSRNKTKFRNVPISSGDKDVNLVYIRFRVFSELLPLNSFIFFLNQSLLPSVQFSSVQSLSRVRLFATLAARLGCS